LGQPTLVRETSWHWFTLWSSWSMIDQVTAMQDLTREFEDIILRPEDKQRILQLALATRNTRRANVSNIQSKKQNAVSSSAEAGGAAPYRHVLLHGPPGTGKTLIARRLAKVSHMDYAILSGGDVAPLGEDAVNQLHALFRWANRSPRGLLVFIDEAEAFLSSRTSNNSNASDENAQHLRNALNALLYQTGAPSRNFMLVLATNRPQDLDAAVLDRIDVSLQISLPGTEQRQALIKLYLDQHVLTIVNNSKQHKSYWSMFARKLKEYGIDADCLSSDAMQYMSDMTRGFSGREISKLFISAQYELYLSMDQTLTWMALQRVVQIKADEHRMKHDKFKLPPPQSLSSAKQNNAEDELHFAQIYGAGPEQGSEEDQFIATSPLSTSPVNFIAPAFDKPTVSRGRSLGRRSVSSQGGGAASGSGSVTARTTRGGTR
jgi:ATPase family AAA domain-containing protein 3A/B